MNGYSTPEAVASVILGIAMGVYGTRSLVRASGHPADSARPGPWTLRAVLIGAATVTVGLAIFYIPIRLFDSSTTHGQISARLYIAATSAILIWIVLRTTRQRLRDVWHWQPRPSTGTTLRQLTPMLGMTYGPTFFFMGAFTLLSVTVGGYVRTVNAPLALLTAVTAGVCESIVLAVAVIITRHYNANLIACIAAMTAFFAWGHAYQGPMIAAAIVWVPLHMWLYARTGSILILAIPHVFLDLVSSLSHVPSADELWASIAVLGLIALALCSAIMYTVSVMRPAKESGSTDVV